MMTGSLIETGALIAVSGRPSRCDRGSILKPALPGHG
jgi:hypothetical protein